MKFSSYIYGLFLQGIRKWRINGGAIKTIHYGSEYGGFNVLVPKEKKEGIVLSFGIGEDISFDEGVIDNLGYDIYAYDPTPKSLEWLKKQKLSDKFHYYPYGLSVSDGVEKFYIPQNPEHVSGSVLVAEHLKKEGIDVQVKSLVSIMKELKIEHIDILKMDIEGSEFAVIPSILKANLLIDQICVEIHHRFIKKENGGKLYNIFMNSPLNPALIKLIKEVKRNGYVLVHISENDEEYTFVHKRIL